jgi:hypothetical protein
MKQRCYNPDNHNYRLYGGRGISVCQHWMDDFTAFFADMGQRPSERHSLERKNNNGNYTPENCVWALPHEQAANRRRSILINGIPLEVVAKQHNIAANTVRKRLSYGWTLEEAISKPVRAK